MLKFILLVLFGIVLALAIFTSCSYFEPDLIQFYRYIGAEPDNVVEEAFEDAGSMVIQHYTGVPVDFDITPSSKE